MFPMRREVLRECWGGFPVVFPICTQLANRQISGSAAAHGFFFSEEFTIQNFSNDEYVTRLYRTFMGREPDPSGFADWAGRLANGASREDVFQGFAGSAEWAEICSNYGIIK